MAMPSSSARVQLAWLLVVITVGCAPHVPLTATAPDIGALRSPAADSQRAAVSADAGARGEGLAFFLCDTASTDTVGVKPPRLIKRAHARYPGTAMHREIQGWVALQFVIGVDGTVEQGSVVVIRASHEEFVATARDAIGQERFAPARRNRMPIRSLNRQLVQFKFGQPQER